MRNRLMILFICFHLVAIIATSVYLTTDGYSSFYKREKPKDAFSIAFRKLISVKAMYVYCKYTGAETGYGFFAPNVLSSGFLAFEHEGRIFSPKLSNYENRLRFSNLASNFIQYAIKPPGCTGADSVQRHSDSAYYDLVLKNISVRFMQTYAMEDTLHVRLDIYDYPTLHDFAERKSLKAKYIPLYEKKYFLHS